MVFSELKQELWALLPQYPPHPILRGSLRNTSLLEYPFTGTVPQVLLTPPCGFAGLFWFCLPRLLGLDATQSRGCWLLLHPPPPLREEWTKGNRRLPGEGDASALS